MVCIDSNLSSDRLMVDISSPDTKVCLTGIGEGCVDTIRWEGKVFQFGVCDEGNGLYIIMVVLVYQGFD